MKIQIDTQTFVRFWLVVIGFALAALIIYSARTGLIIVAAAFFVALILNEPVSRLAVYMPSKSRGISTAVAYIIIVAVIGIFGYLAVPPIIQQTAKFTETLPQLVDNITNSWHGLDATIDKYNLRPQVDQSLMNIRENASKLAANVGGTLLTSLSSLFSALAAVFLVLVLSILMLIEGPVWMERIWRLYRSSDKMERHRNVVQKMHRIVSGYAVGQLTVSAIGAVFAGVSVFVLSFFFNVPANLAIPTAALTFLFSLIPMFGATIGGAIITLVLLFNAAGAAIAYVVFFIVYQQFENNFISPGIQSKRLNLSPLAVLSSVTVGLYLFGLAGGIISIPIAGCIKVLIEDHLEHTKKTRAASGKPLHKLATKIKKS